MVKKKKNTAQGFKDESRQKKDKCKWYAPEVQDRSSTRGGEEIDEAASSAEQDSASKEPGTVR